MKKLLVTGAALAALIATPAAAQSTDAGAAVGGTAGGIGGAITGGLIFGPIGAIIGGFTGAIIGASVVSEASIEHARLHPTTPVVIDGAIEVGYVVPAHVEIVVFADDPDYGYFYTEDRLWVVELDTRTVVYSPGLVVAGELHLESN